MVSSYFYLNYLGLSPVTYSVNGELVFHLQLSFNYVFFSLIKYDSKIKDTRFMDLVAIDSPGKERRFSLFSIFSNTYFSSKKKLVNFLSYFDRAFPMYRYFASAVWAEREVYDMFGIGFVNHFDMRRVLSDYGFLGHPMRKDFPLSGYLEVFFDETFKRGIYSKVVLAQEYRNFTFSRNWSPVIPFWRTTVALFERQYQLLLDSSRTWGNKPSIYYLLLTGNRPLAIEWSLMDPDGPLKKCKPYV